MSQEQPTGSSPQPGIDQTTTGPVAHPESVATPPGPAPQPPLPASGPAPAYPADQWPPAVGAAPPAGAPPAYPTGPAAPQQPGVEQPAAGSPAVGSAVATGTQPMTPEQERTSGLAAHGIALAATVISGGFLGFLGALVMYLVLRDRGPFVRSHTANALNIQITVAIGYAVATISAITIIGLIVAIPLWVALFVYAVITHVIGMTKANNGEWWDPPLTPKFVK
ncbi:MAG TPA: DUF4870 domain-containing protein [Dermatophilaceae bacterium]|nr:DUF4870 domain-containing protein [Dermatophilaceae bacterium]